jgi:hypothetical protein
MGYLPLGFTSNCSCKRARAYYTAYSEDALDERVTIHVTVSGSIVTLMDCDRVPPYEGI